MEKKQKIIALYLFQKEVLTARKQGLHGAHGDCGTHKGHLSRSIGGIHQRRGAPAGAGDAEEEEFDSDELHKRMHMLHEGSSELGDEDEVCGVLYIIRTISYRQ